MPKKKKKTPEVESEVVGFLGVGLDDDGHRRVTQSDHFFLVGGSKETHERMQETAVKFEEALEEGGQALRELPVHQVIELLRRVRRK